MPPDKTVPPEEPVQQPSLGLKKLSRAEQDVWWQELGGDEALERAEKTLQESNIVSDELLSSMIR